MLLESRAEFLPKEIKQILGQVKKEGRRRNARPKGVFWWPENEKECSVGTRLSVGIFIFFSSLVGDTIDTYLGERGHDQKMIARSRERYLAC